MAFVRRRCEGAAMVLTRMLRAGEKSFSASLDTAIRLPIAKGTGANDRQVRYRERMKGNERIEKRDQLR